MSKCFLFILILYLIINLLSVIIYIYINKTLYFILIEFSLLKIYFLIQQIKFDKKRNKYN